MRRLLPAAAVLAALTLAAPAAASPTGIVISEFRFRGPAGGNDEFVELRNTTSAPVAIGGYRLFGCSAAGAASSRATVPAGVELPAGGSYLFTNSGSSGYTGQALGDTTYGTGIADGGAAQLRSDATTVVDAVGAAGNLCAEGAGIANIPTSNGDNAYERREGGTQDTNDNAADFVVHNPSQPQNLSGKEVVVNAARIHAVQGSGDTSPMAGQQVVIEGVVTGMDDEIGSNFERTFPADAGLFVQEEPADADANAATSEGIYVGFVRNRTAYPPGTVVRVRGQVVEQFGETRIEELVDLEPVKLGQAPVPDATAIDAAAAASQSPAAREYYEQLEGMRVVLQEGTATVGGTSKFGELFLSPGVHQDPDDRVFRTENPSDLIAADADAGAGDPSNPLIDTDSTTEIPGDLFDVVRNVDGPLAYAFNNFRILNQPAPAPQPEVVPSPVAPYPYDGVAPRAADQLRFASYNVENFFPVGGDVDRHLVTQEEYEAKRDDIVTALRDRLQRPDVIALQEVVDKAIADDVAAQLGGYTAYLEEGNDGRGIDVAFLVRDTVQASNLRQLGKTAPAPAGRTCSELPGGLFDRPPLAIDIAVPGVRFTAISNHFSSKSAVDACREAQAAFVRDVVKDIEAGGGEAIVAGDLNSFEDEVALDVLEDGSTSLDNLWDEAPEQERYSFQFQGRLQTLDHVLVTDGLAGRELDTRYVHLGNDYYDRRAVDGHDASDHDPVLVTLDLPSAPVNVTAPSIGGMLKRDHVLVGDEGAWTVDEGPLSFSLQWLRCADTSPDSCLPIAGATSETYVPSRPDKESYLRLRVTAKAPGGTTVAESAPYLVK